MTPETSKMYKTSLYQIEYPSDWNYEKFNTVSGDSVIFKPKENVGGNYYPSISVSTVQNSKASIETKENNTEFLIKYQYEGSNENAELEKLFKVMVATFLFL